MAGGVFFAPDPAAPILRSTRLVAGRRSKLTDALRDRVCDALRCGNTRKVAATLGGIDQVTFYAYLKKGEEQSHGIYREFLNAVARAEAECAEKMLKAITSAMPTDWRAAAFWLERRMREDFGPKQQVEHSGGQTIKYVQELGAGQNPDDL